MKVSNLAYGWMRNTAYLLKSKHKPINKLKILFNAARINLKYPLSKIFNTKKDKFLGFKVQAFDYLTIRFLFQEIFMRNEYFFQTNKKPIILDCGANIGFATLYFKWLYPESEIHAFEPDKQTFELLKKNIHGNNLKDVHLYNAAVADKDGQMDFFIDPGRTGSLAMSTKFERMPKQRVTVDTLALSKFADKQIDLLKMDIEGGEESVIQDLHNKGLLGKFNKMIIEYHLNIDDKSKLGAFLNMFEQNGFRYQVDTMCMPLSSHNKFQDVMIYAYK